MDVNKNFTGQGGFFRVTTAGNLAKEKISFPTLTMEHPGYIYVFLYNRSNSSNWVYFDDLKVTHQRSPIVAGADFYPFGLPMEGREITQEGYRWGYQGQYAEKDTVTGWNQFQLRMYDARFGRWLSVDPYGQYASPYLGMGNVPHMGVDPDGGLFGLSTPWSQIVGAAVGATIGAGVGLVIDWANDGKIDDGYWKIGAGAGAIAGFLWGELTAGNTNSNMGSAKTRSKSPDGKISTNQRKVKWNKDNLHQRTYYTEIEEEIFVPLQRESGRALDEYAKGVASVSLKSSWNYMMTVRRTSGNVRIFNEGRLAKEITNKSGGDYDIPKGSSSLDIEVDPDYAAQAGINAARNLNLDVRPPSGQADIRIRGESPRLKVRVYRSGLLGLKVHKKVVSIAPSKS